jgi:hypothetical protein
MFGLQQQDTFRCWVPFDLIEKGDEPNTGLGHISGIASSETMDADGDVIVQAGIDWSLFTSKGLLTYEHPFGVQNIVGEPRKVELTEVNGVPATKVDAALYLTDPLGKSIHGKSSAMRKAGGNRRLGYSIEGHVIKRNPDDPHKVEKSRVKTIAVTAFPKNDDSWFEPIAASLMAAGWSPPMYRAETVGYPVQGQAAAGVGGIEKIAMQSLQGVGGKMPSKTYGLDGRDIITATLLKKLPQWTWAQGRAIADKVIAKVQGFKEFKP